MQVDARIILLTAARATMPFYNLFWWVFILLIFCSILRAIWRPRLPRRRRRKTRRRKMRWLKHPPKESGRESLSLMVGTLSKVAAELAIATQNNG
jgi:hypothetical protein